MSKSRRKLNGGMTESEIHRQVDHLSTAEALDLLDKDRRRLTPEQCQLQAEVRRRHDQRLPPCSQAQLDAWTNEWLRNHPLWIED